MLQSRSAADHGIPPTLRASTVFNWVPRNGVCFPSVIPKAIGSRWHSDWRCAASSPTKLPNTACKPPIYCTLFAGAIWLIIGKAFRPLQTISQAVAERHIGHLSPIDIANTPTEVQALILAINRLLAREGTSLVRATIHRRRRSRTENPLPL